MRKDFEDWFLGQNGYFKGLLDQREGRYTDNLVEQAWQAYQKGYEAGREDERMRHPYKEDMGR